MHTPQFVTQNTSTTVCSETRFSRVTFTVSAGIKNPTGIILGATVWTWLLDEATGVVPTIAFPHVNTVKRANN